MRIVKDLDLDLTDRHVLIVEDIVDSGLTLAYLRKNLAARGPRVAGGVRAAGEGRPAARRARPEVRGLHASRPTFVVGYGLDVGERYRNLPYIAEYAGPEAGLTPAPGPAEGASVTS